MGGVSASVSPDLIVRVAVAVPAAFVAVIVTGYDPAAGEVPVMMPVAASMVSPAGRPVAVNVSGACPVVGTVNRNGLAALVPVSAGPRIRGAAGGAVIEIVMSVVAASATGPIARGVRAARNRTFMAGKCLGAGIFAKTVRGTG